jgi:hypothetical protein
MNRMRPMLLSTALALALAGLLLIHAQAQAAHGLARDEGSSTAAVAELCVNPGGTAGCYDSIQAAVNAASAGSTIRVAAGTYYEAIVVSKSLTLEGGWNAELSERDWDTYVTTVDAERAGPVFWINAAVTPTIEGFVITGGDDSTGLGWGGGVKFYRPGAVDPAGLVTIRHNVITDNIACAAPTCQGFGGGIMIHRGRVVIESNTIVSNVARLAEGGSGRGGGVSIHTSDATLTGNAILSNTAVLSTTGFSDGKGGGVEAQYARDLVLVGNEIRGNVAAVKGTGYGGGVYATYDLFDNRILSNTASISGTGYGGGVCAYQVGRFEDNLVQGNVASSRGDGSGGGIFAQYLRQAVHNTILNNSASRGGGVYYREYHGDQVLRDNLIARNQATGDDFDTLDGGGGIASAADWVEITGNRILSNTAQSNDGTGGGVQIKLGTRYILQDNTIAGNSSAGGGGIAVYTATGSIKTNTIFNNRAVLGGGMYVWGAASPELDRNVVMSNTAAGFFAAGGGMLLNPDAGTAITVTNHFIGQNAAGPNGTGGGLVCMRGDCVLVNNTVVDNDRGSFKEGVVLGNGSHTVYNNIIAGHSVGVSLSGGSVDLDYNDYFDNGTATDGVTWGAHHRTDDPQFKDRAAGDYHLALSSPVADRGATGRSPDHDIDGDARPRGTAADIGADETYPLDVYVSESNGSDLIGAGTQTNPYATVSKGLGEVGGGGSVHVARGEYGERITVTKSVDLLGGYHEGTWSRDIPAHVTTLDAQGSGTVVVIYGPGVHATVDGFTITGGEASLYGSGGGIVVFDDATASIRHNRIHANHAQNGGAGLVVWGIESGPSVVEANEIFDNVAEGEFPPTPLMTNAPLSPQQGPEAGGGVLVAGGQSRVVNNLIYGNSAAAGGDGIAVVAWEEAVVVLHNTLVDNGGSQGTGILAVGSPVRIENNLIVGHATGISGTASVDWGYNGFFDNQMAYGAGLSGGAHDAYADPSFVDRAAGNYHITLGSLMAGAGDTAGVTTDVDGESRPAPPGSRPDIGADEVDQYRTWLPFLRR